MKKSYFTLFIGSTILANLLFTGCGGDIRKDNQPHRINAKTLLVSSEIATTGNTNPWYNNVSIAASYDENSKFSLDIAFNNGLASNIKHTHVYIDTDDDESTGFSDMAISGADYMIEDGTLFKSKSDTEWNWQQIDEIDHVLTSKRLKLSGDSDAVLSMIDIDDVQNLNISIGAVDTQWEDVGNFVALQSIDIDITRENGINPDPVNPDPVNPDPVNPDPVNPDPVNPDPVNPDPVEDDEDGTLYEDAENGIAAWYTASGAYTPQRRTLDGQAYVKLKTDWLQIRGDNWKNRAEYHLLMDNDEQTILSVDLVGDGEEMHHYILGVQVTTEQGVRRLAWDSFYNHENMPAERLNDANGIVYMIFPSPVEMVRGYGYADVDLQENFRVDLEDALREFEPNNEIISVDTFFATGGNLDNIKLLD